MDDLTEKLIRIFVSAVMGVLMLIIHVLIDTFFKGVIYYIPTSLKGVGVPVQITYINVAIITADVVLTVAGTILILLSGLALLMIIKKTMNGTYI